MEKVEKTSSKGFLSKIQSRIINEKNLDAYGAYLLSRYGLIESKDKRLSEFYTNLDNLISAKANASQYCCATEIPDELVNDFLKEIISSYEKKGFTVVDLAGKLENVQRHYIFITWDNKF